MNTAALFRLLLRLLPAALVASGLAALAAAFLAWGAAEHVEIPAWETTFVGASIALPAIVLGMILFKSTWRATRTNFSATWLLLIPGASALLLASAVVAGVASVIGDPSTYDQLRDADGTINTSPEGFLFIGAFAAIVLAAGIAFPVFLYGLAVSANPNTKFDRTPDEYDAMADMLKGRRGPRTRI